MLNYCLILAELTQQQLHVTVNRNTSCDVFLLLIIVVSYYYYYYYYKELGWFRINRSSDQLYIYTIPAPIA